MVDNIQNDLYLEQYCVAHDLQVVKLYLQLIHMAPEVSISAHLKSATMAVNLLQPIFQFRNKLHCVVRVPF